MAGWGWQAVHDPAELPRVIRRSGPPRSPPANRSRWSSPCGAPTACSALPHPDRAPAGRQRTGGALVRGQYRDRRAGPAEAALRASEGRLRRAKEAGGVGVSPSTSPATTSTGTPNFFRLYGLPEQDRLPVDVIARPRQPGRCRLIARRADRAAGRAARDVAYRIRRADTGAERWIAWRGAVRGDGAGRAVRFVGAQCANIRPTKAARGARRGQRARAAPHHTMRAGADRLHRPGLHLPVSPMRLSYW